MATTFHFKPNKKTNFPQGSNWGYFYVSYTGTQARPRDDTTSPRLRGAGRVFNLHYLGPVVKPRDDNGKSKNFVIPAQAGTGSIKFFNLHNLGSVVIRLRFAAPRQEPRDDTTSPRLRGAGRVLFVPAGQWIPAVAGMTAGGVFCLVFVCGGLF
ncbi:MAG: hypothetical protein IKK76_02005, partial [Alphaproteobacteria bacterium]|nr:hypothetical protein [Alphaproteobacteria bacterium]